MSFTNGKKRKLEEDIDYDFEIEAKNTEIEDVECQIEDVECEREIVKKKKIKLEDQEKIMGKLPARAQFV